MPLNDLKKFSATKQREDVVNVALPGQMSMDDYMRQAFGSDAVPANELPSDETTLSVVFDYCEEVK